MVVSTAEDMFNDDLWDCDVTPSSSLCLSSRRYDERLHFVF
jgi:hypothetical protein